MSNETIKPAFEMTDTGEIYNNKKGKSTLLATFDSETGRLEFVDLKSDRYYREQIIRCITEDTEGVASGNKVSSYAIKGESEDDIKKNEPAKPKGTKQLGDKTPEVVEWYFKWRPKEAYIRYGVQLDENGKPVRKHCKRRERRMGEDPVTGKVELVDHIVENENGIIATRGTHMTFLKEEVVGADINSEEGED